MTLEEGQSLALELKTYCVSQLFDEMEYDHPDQVRALYQFRFENMAHMLTASFRVPTEVLQADSVVADYPATLWQHIKKALGLSYQHKQVRLNECLIYPTLSWRPNHRLYVCIRRTDGTAD